MIARVFRGQIRSAHHAELEDKFRQISLPLVQVQRGLVSVSIGRTLPSGPDEVVMISTWIDLDALRAFTDDYTAAVIPHGMEEHMVQSWVHHYELIL
jgi:heme-degrading monooxygenase HmoA